MRLVAYYTPLQQQRPLHLAPYAAVEHRERVRDTRAIREVEEIIDEAEDRWPDW